MRFSRWDANGNVYLLAEQGELTPDRVRAEVGSADGIVEVVAAADDAAEVVIWNPDGSTAELSGNGTRIAAAWLADRSGATEIVIRVGGREVRARMLGDGLIEQELGAVEVGKPEHVDGIEVTPVSVGNPHAVVLGDPDELARLGPLLETHARFPERTNVQVARIDAPGEVTARVWERGVGETASSGTSAVAVAAATHREGEVVVHFPGGALRVRLAGGRAWLTGPVKKLDDAVRALIVHIARQAEWQQARDVGEYAPSSLAREGFIHLSRPEQAHLPANALYSGQRDLVLLWVDPTWLRAELRYEAPEPGALEFPHLYGSLNLDAVVAETRLEPWERGAFTLPAAPGDVS
jgi:diaminopimelate epimerase